MEDIPMSSSIIELENIDETNLEDEKITVLDNNISKNDDILIKKDEMSYKNINFLTQDNEINHIKNTNNNIDLSELDIDEMTFDEIIDTQDLLSNDFIKYINTNLPLDKDPDYSEIAPYYYKKSLKKFGLCNSKLKNVILILTRTFQLILYLWVMLGIFMPRKFLIAHVISCMTLIVTLEYTSNYGLINIFLTFLLNKKQNSDLIILDESPYVIKFIIMILMSISVFGILFPKYSIFSLLSYFINYF